MADVVIAFSVLLLPFVLSVGAVVLWYRSLAKPLVYAVASLLSLVGLQLLLRETISPVAFAHFYTGEEGSVVVHEQRDSLVPFLQWQIPIALGLIVIGLPYLWWLKNAFRGK